MNRRVNQIAYPGVDKRVASMKFGPEYIEDLKNAEPQGGEAVAESHVPDETGDAGVAPRQPAALPPASETPRTDALSDYPNLEAIYMGTISGAFREWPMVRDEFRSYVLGMTTSESDLRRKLAALRAPLPELHVIFDGPPSHESGRFVEVESADGKSVRVGEWKQVGDYWHLILPGRVPQEPLPDVESQVQYSDYLLAGTEVVLADFARAQGQQLREWQHKAAQAVTAWHGCIHRAEAAERQLAEARKDYHEIKRELSLTQAELAEAQNNLSVALFQLEKARKDAERYRWAKPILSGDNAVLADSRARQLAAGLMAQLDPDQIIDAALAGKEKP